jgi:RNA polymerase sigma factor (TIGR02999 family)
MIAQPAWQAGTATVPAIRDIIADDTMLTGEVGRVYSASTRDTSQVSRRDMERPSEVTQLLFEWRQGDAEALDRLVPLVYAELRRVASRQLRSERSDHTLQPTALVHEAYARLVDAEVAWTDRTHFFAIAARTMRRVLVDHARGLQREKRGGGAVRVTLDENLEVEAGTPDEMLALDAALDRLQEIDARKADVVQLHYFGGLTYDQIAEALGISAATVDRDLRMAKAWLHAELEER